MKKTAPNHVRTWIEIDSRAAKKNYDTFRKLIEKNAAGKKVQLWSVVKSNAYGHGLFIFSKLMQQLGIDGLCVDSIIEALALRREGIKKPILVLGPTLPSRYADAARHHVIISISNFEALRALARAKRIPDFHIKIDTGMHRQGFYVEEIPKVIKQLHTIHAHLHGHFKGVFTHFASAKDINYPTYTDEQLKKYEKAVDLFEKAGFKNLIKHAAATGGALISPKYHLDAVRIGIGMYGLWPSKELELQLGNEVKLHPVLSWRTVVSEVKKIKAGDYIGYDLAERISHDGAMAILPIGYWHGLPRALSSVGEVLVGGKRARIVGRVSMDITAVLVEKAGGVPTRRIKPGDIVTIVGRDGNDHVFMWEIAQRAGTNSYEFPTRLNPLMERIVL